MVMAKRDEYLDEKTKKLEKAHIAAQIVYIIRSKGGRFLKEEADGAWWDIGDQKAIKKVGQAMREDAPNMRAADGTAKKGDSPVSAARKAKTSAPPAAVSSSAASSSSRKHTTAPESYQSLSPAAAAAVNNGYDEYHFPVPAAKSEVFGREFIPPGSQNGSRRDASMLSGTSAPSAMSGVSEISGLTDPISALSGSNNGSSRPNQHHLVPKANRDRMMALGERVALDQGYGLPDHHASSNNAAEDASLDMMSLMSLGNMSNVLKEADRQSVSSKQFMDELSAVSGGLSGLSLEASQLYEM